MGEEPPKKDLTSLIELSAIEHALHPNGPPGGHGGDMEAMPIEKISEEDFGDLEELSKAANKHAFEHPEPAAPEPIAVPPPVESPPPEQAAPPELAALPELSDSAPMAMNETGPGESPGGHGDAADSNAMPSFMDDHNAVVMPAEESPGGMELPSHSQMGTQDVPGIEGLPGGDVELGGDLSGSEGLPSEPVQMGTASHEEPAEAAPPESTITTTSSPVQAHTPTVPGMAPPPTPKSQLDPNRAVVNAAPAGAAHTRKSGEPATAKQDMSALRKFADKLSIGKPKIEGAPAFSILATNANGYFDAKTITAIENAITSEDFGIRVEDVAVQLTAGKLLVPQISEFAAITLAQKLRDVVDNIEVDLATEIFKGSAAELGNVDESILMDAEEFETHHEEVHDMGAEPRNENDIFTTNLPELGGFQVTRILSIVIASEIIPADIAENPTSKEFEGTTERLTEELVKRAFKLGSHGVLGINFTLKSIEAYKDTSGKVRRAYRMIGTGTAVRARKRSDL